MSLDPPEVVVIIQSQWQREKPAAKFYHIALNQCLFPTIVTQIPAVANLKPILGNRLVLQNYIGSTSWCKCVKCAPVPNDIESQCCKEMEGVVESVAENESHQCITDHEQFKVVCLNIDVLYTVLVMMNRIRGDPVSLPLRNR